MAYDILFSGLASIIFGKRKFYYQNFQHIVTLTTHNTLLLKFGTLTDLHTYTG